jgi:hypothetical protein
MRRELLKMELTQFLIKAKTNTYATGGEGGERILVDGSKELTFEEGGFVYRDRYFGFDPFIGEEVVWQAGEVVWAMNYYGWVVEPIVATGEVYQFLQKAMRQVEADRPFRGPSHYAEGDFEYHDTSQGSIEGFQGTEKILYKGRQVYRLVYHGGLVRST